MEKEQTIYLVIKETVWDFLRTEFIIESFTDETDAKAYYWSMVSKTKKYLNRIRADDWVIENKDSTWEAYPSGSWAEFHLSVIYMPIIIM